MNPTQSPTPGTERDLAALLKEILADACDAEGEDNLSREHYRRLHEAWAALSAPPLKQEAEAVDDDVLEEIIGSSDGAWHEDVFHVEGPELMRMLRRASQSATTQEVDTGVIDLARMFHDKYEQLAPGYGYETRADTRVFDPLSKNGRLMIAVVSSLRNALLTSQPPSSQGEPDMAKDAARVPEGWKLVPIDEPTEAMVDAFENAMEGANTYVRNFLAAYRAMLAAAPSIDSSMAAAKGEAP